MILQALYDYYHRCGDLPRKGMELKEIGFLIVIDKDGHFLRFEDRRIDKKQAQKFLVKKHVGRTSALVANHLYDNSGYVFGYSEKVMLRLSIIPSKRKLKVYTNNIQTTRI